MVNLKRKKFCQISRIFFKLQFRASNYRTRDIISRSWWEVMHKDRIFWKNLLKNKEMVVENGVKNIQAAAYDGARTVIAAPSTVEWL